MFYSSEALLQKNMPAIEEFWQNEMTKGFVDTKQGKLFYAYHLPFAADFAIVISSGRIEAAQKYQELLWELARNNVAVFIVDHQGQGLSYRHLEDKQRGHVGHFDDYVRDLKQFDQQVVQKHWQGKKVLVGHSMGGAIALDFACHDQHDFSGVFLSAPMLALDTGSTPPWAAKALAKAMTLLGNKQGYVPGHGPYHEVPFEENELTHSEVRYRSFRQLYKSNESLQLGGVTYGWLNAAFNAIRKLAKSRCPVPLFVASAQCDTVVDNRPYDDFVHSQKHALVKTYQGAKHELFCEQDSVRKVLLRDLLRFCRQL